MNRNQFFIIGAQRSGTTYLYTVLDEHPQICMAKPARPEPKFFISDTAVGWGKELYESHYYTRNNARAYGEKSTSYIEHPLAIEGILAFYPEARILIMLRNPVERALSNYFFSVENGIETRSLEEVFLKNTPPPELHLKTSVSPFAYLDRGIYIDYIRPYIDAFGRERTKILTMEEFTGNADGLRELFSFLEVDPSVTIPSVEQIVNGAERRTPVDDAIYQHLTKYYSNYNILLSEYLNIDLQGIWK